MNYRYSVSGEVHILTKDEHDFIKAGVKKGETKFVLRNGDIVIDWSGVKSARPTHELTAEQERIDAGITAALPEPHRTPEQIEAIKKQFCEGRTKMGWPHPQDCWCKSVKEIPMID